MKKLPKIWRKVCWYNLYWLTKTYVPPSGNFSSTDVQICMTCTFTASGLAAPPYIAVGGLTEEELSPDTCPDGILGAEVEGLCKGGGDIFNKNKGRLLFLRADKN